MAEERLRGPAEFVHDDVYAGVETQRGHCPHPLTAATRGENGTLFVGCFVVVLFCCLVRCPGRAIACACASHSLVLES